MIDIGESMPGKKANYEDGFSGKTRSIIMTLTRILLDSNLEIREKHMFGAKAFLIHGHVMMLVGEWARVEKPKEGIVEIGRKGEAEATLIVIPRDEKTAEAFRKKYGGLYFAPSGVRLKHWLSFTGTWLADEDKLAPLVGKMLAAYSELPHKPLKNPGRFI